MPKAKENTNQQAVIFGLVTLLVGLALLFSSAWLELTERRIRAAVSRELGAFCIVTVIVTLIWELYAHRRIQDELYERVGMSHALAQAGIIRATNDFSGVDIDFHALIDESQTLDMFVAYANTWRNSYANPLRRMLLRDGSRLRVVLPNPANHDIVRALASRFQQTEAAMEQNIRLAADGYRELSAREGAVQVRFVDKIPVFTFYLFDHRAVIALYNHRSGRLPVPSFLCKRGGWLAQYLRDEFEALVEVN